MNGLLALAFAAGMLAPVNPCGFALLPAWFTYTIGDTHDAPTPVRLARSLRAGAALTLGFAGTLTAMGIAVSAGAHAVIGAAPWLGLAIGVALVLVGVVMLAGLLNLWSSLTMPAGRLEGRPITLQTVQFVNASVRPCRTLMVGWLRLRTLVASTASQACSSRCTALSRSLGHECHD